MTVFGWTLTSDLCHTCHKINIVSVEGWLCVSLWAMWHHSESHLPADVGEIEGIYIYIYIHTHTLIVCESLGDVTPQWVTLTSSCRWNRGYIHTHTHTHTPLIHNFLRPDSLSFQADVGHSVHPTLDTRIQDAGWFASISSDLSAQRIPMSVTLPGPGMIRYLHGHETNCDRVEVP